LHKSACLSCAWGTGGQKGGFVNEDGEVLQRCAKSVEAIASELQDPISPDFFQTYNIDRLQQLDSEAANNLGRWSYPVIFRAGNNYYERISRAEIDSIAGRAFRQPPTRIASYSSGRSSNEAAFLLQLMLRSIGSNNLADCSDLCHSASTVALRDTFGSGTSMVSLEGLKQSDCVVLVGSNAPANHPRLLNELIKLRERGGKVIVINPIIEVGLVRFASPAYPLKSLLRGSPISSLYLQPIPGSDVAVFLGIQKALIEGNSIDLDYLEAHTEGYRETIDAARETPWELITETCGIDSEELKIAADIIANSQKVVFAWAMGATQHDNGVDNIYSIANTALMTGNAGKLGAGTMPIRGHSNVQGFGSMGVTIHLKKQLEEALEKLLERPLRKVKGYDTRALIEAANAGKVSTLLCLGGNLYAANPDSTQVKRALAQIDTIIYLATKPNPGHFHGLAKINTIVIPVCARFENPHETTTESGNNFVRLNDRGTTHIKNGDLISEVEFITRLARSILGDVPINWGKLQDTRYVRQLIAQTIPDYAKIGEIDATKQEFTIDNRIFSEPKFDTPTGKARMFVTPLPKLHLPTAADLGISPAIPSLILILMAGRSYSQHNTVVYQSGDRYRGMPHRHCILMNREDVMSMGWQERQRVTVRGNAGELNQIEIIYGEVRRGAALMFYPEVNAIFRAKIDERSGTPAFKRVPVAVYRSSN
jgi:molybdopterin-dependent oxidoreductase alpha subunit